MSGRVVDYGMVENMRHADQAEAEAVGWHEAMGHFKSDRERDAYRAGFRKAWADCRAMFALHAGVSLRTKAREAPHA